MVESQLFLFVLLLFCFGVKVLTAPTTIPSPSVANCSGCYGIASVDEVIQFDGSSINVPVGTLTWSFSSAINLAVLQSSTLSGSIMPTAVPETTTLTYDSIQHTTTYVFTAVSLVQRFTSAGSCVSTTSTSVLATPSSYFIPAPSPSIAMSSIESAFVNAVKFTCRSHLESETTWASSLTSSTAELTPSFTFSNVSPTIASSNQVIASSSTSKTSPTTSTRKPVTLAPIGRPTHVPPGRSTAPSPKEAESSKTGLSKSDKTSITLCVGLGIVLFLAFLVFLCRMTAIQANEARYDMRFIETPDRNGPILAMPSPTYGNYSRNLPIEASSQPAFRPHPELSDVSVLRVR